MRDVVREIDLGRKGKASSLLETQLRDRGEAEVNAKIYLYI